MKTYWFIASWLLTVTTALAQSASPRNDALYSTGNYKHANKAAEARRWEQSAGVPVAPPTTLGNVANYKRPVPGQTPAGGVSAEYNGPVLVNRNYKTRQSIWPPTSETRFAKRRKVKPDSSGTVIGE